MTLEEYKDKYKNTGDIDFEEPTKEMIEAWLDEKIEVIERAKDVDYPIVWGEYNDGDFENEIEMCSVSNTLHVYTGIKHIARILGEKLQERYHSVLYKYCYYFDYKGIEIFEITNERIMI